MLQTTTNNLHNWNFTRGVQGLEIIFSAGEQSYLNWTSNKEYFPQDGETR